METHTIRIAPSILSADFSRLGEEIQAVEKAGADWIHVDVMDGHFVPNLTVGPLLVEAARRVTQLPLDVHLMILHPERYIEAFARAGADRITVHVEACPHLHRVVEQIREVGCRPGVALNPATPLEWVIPILPDLDLLLVMSVNPGFGGQQFIPRVLEKVGRARELICALDVPVLLEVDGGVKVDNARALGRQGAQVLVAGSAIFGERDPAAYEKIIRRMREEAEKGMREDETHRH